MSTNPDEKIWKRKIIALLHDPIYKIINIKGHEKIAKDVLKKVFKDESIKIDIYKNADSRASSADRLPLPNEKANWYSKKKKQSSSSSDRIIVDFGEATYIHPFSGEVLGVNDVSDPYSNFKKTISNLSKNNNSPYTLYLKNSKDECQKFYLNLWWEMPTLAEGSYMLPADTRIPDHSIIDHLETTAAFSSITTANYSLITVSVCPVREFIAAGRKIIDLKVGSYLLSYLVYSGIKYLGERYGFDCIVFPCMRGNYFLQKDYNLPEKTGVQYDVACIPNVFTAIVPKKDIDTLKNNIPDAIKNEMRNISSYFKEHTVSSFTKKYNNEQFEHVFTNEKIKIQDWEQFWDKQVEEFPTIFIVSQEINNSDTIIKTAEEYLHSESTFIDEIKKLPNTYAPKGATFYGLASQLLTIKHSLRKSTREFEQNIEEFASPGDDISGNNKALYLITDNYEKDGKSYIEEEKLSAISFIKRYFIDYLKYQKSYEEAYENLKNIKSPEELSDGYKLSILMMSGDSMGEWISGKKAPSLEKRFHSKVIEKLNKKNNDYLNTLKNEKRLISPSYHRTLSRTLNSFSNLVPLLVKKYSGMLIYIGGDDILAMFPSNKVLRAANDIRKLYSGNNFELDNYIFKNGWAYDKTTDMPMYNMMSSSATMSAGIVSTKPKFNLKTSLYYVRNLEKKAKSYGRNSFAIGSVRGTGVFSNTVSKWDIGDFDILSKVADFFDFYNERSTKHLIAKIKYHYETLCFEKRTNNELLSCEDFINNLLPFILDNRMGLNEEEIKKISELFNIYLTSTERTDKMNGIREMLEVLEEFEYTVRKMPDDFGGNNFE